MGAQRLRSAWRLFQTVGRASAGDRAAHLDLPGDDLDRAIVECEPEDCGVRVIEVDWKCGECLRCRAGAERHLDLVALPEVPHVNLDRHFAFLLGNARFTHG